MLPGGCHDSLPLRHLANDVDTDNHLIGVDGDKIGNRHRVVGLGGASLRTRLSTARSNHTVNVANNNSTGISVINNRLSVFSTHFSNRISATSIPGNHLSVGTTNAPELVDVHGLGCGNRTNTIGTGNIVSLQGGVN